MRNFFAYGLGPNIPPNTGYFLARFCYRQGGMRGARLPDPATLARILAIKADNLTAIIGFLRQYDLLTVEIDGALALTEQGASWWKEYKRSVSRESLNGMLHTAGLGRVADVIEQQALPSIRLSAHIVEDEDTLLIGGSRIGGSPDLPPGYEWPRNGEFSMAFIAQINLADVALYDVARLLPRAGMLYFFVDYAHLYNAWPTPPTIHRVLYHDDASAKLHRTVMPPPLPEWLFYWDHPHFGPYQSCSVTFAEELTLADYLPYYYESWHSGIREILGPITEPFTEAERRAFAEVERRLRGPAYTINRMLGHPDPIQGFDLSPEDALLLQIDSEEDAGMMWGDVGRLYWWMGKDELARRDFDNVKFDEQCS